MNPMDLFNQVKEMIEKMIWANTLTKLSHLFQVTKWLVEL